MTDMIQVSGPIETHKLLSIQCRLQLTNDSNSQEGMGEAGAENPKPTSPLGAPHLHGILS